MPDNTGQGGRAVEIRIDALRPADWFYKESITLLAPDGSGNVIASSEPISAEMAAADYAGLQGDALAKEFPGYIELAFEKITVFGGLAGWLRQFEWVPPDGEAVWQLQVYAVKDGRGYTATATSTQAQSAELESTFVEILSSLVLKSFSQITA